MEFIHDPNRTTLENLEDLYQFLGRLTPEQRKQPIRLSGDEAYPKQATQAHILECDYINPSGDAGEPVNDYKEGGQFYGTEEAIDLENEPVIAKEGDIYIYYDMTPSERKFLQEKTESERPCKQGE